MNNVANNSIKFKINDQPYLFLIDEVEKFCDNYLKNYQNLLLTVCTY